MLAPTPRVQRAARLPRRNDHRRPARPPLGHRRDRGGRARRALRGVRDRRPRLGRLFFDAAERMDRLRRRRPSARGHDRALRLGRGRPRQGLALLCDGGSASLMLELISTPRDRPSRRSRAGRVAVPAGDIRYRAGAVVERFEEHHSRLRRCALQLCVSGWKWLLDRHGCRARRSGSAAHAHGSDGMIDLFSQSPANRGRRMRRQSRLAGGVRRPGPPPGPFESRDETQPQPASDVSAGNLPLHQLRLRKQVWSLVVAASIQCPTFWASTSDWHRGVTLSPARFQPSHVRPQRRFCSGSDAGRGQWHHHLGGGRSRTQHQAVDAWRGPASSSANQPNSSAGSGRGRGAPARTMSELQHL